MKIFMRDKGCSVGFSQHKSAKIRDSVVGKSFLGGGDVENLFTHPIQSFSISSSFVSNLCQPPSFS